eukprot:10065491-Prorocentrum_lima.AAC.1
MEEALFRRDLRLEWREERRVRRLERNRRPWELASSDSNYEPSDNATDYVPSSDSEYGGPYDYGGPLSRRGRYAPASSGKWPPII